MRQWASHLQWQAVRGGGSSQGYWSSKRFSKEKVDEIPPQCLDMSRPKSCCIMLEGLHTEFDCHGELD